MGLVLVCALSAGPTAAEAHSYPTAVTRWRDEALAAGWPSYMWPWLRCVINRESRGNPRAYNGRDPAGGSRGLTQINGINTRSLRRAGIIRNAQDLYNPVRNLRAARFLFRHHGTRPWGGACRG